MRTTDPDAVGYNHESWDEENGQRLYNTRVINSNPLAVQAELKPYPTDNGEPIPEDWEYYFVDLEVQTIAPNTMLIY